VDQHASTGTVTIVGAGLGGISLVANLGLLGYRLRLHDVDEARIARVRERGGADVIIVVTGSHFHTNVARGLAGVLRDGRLRHAASRLPRRGTQPRSVGPGQTL
jgi:threonine dehydrogenase-like Zn-dependent dehydrogenase